MKLPATLIPRDSARQSIQGLSCLFNTNKTALSFPRFISSLFFVVLFIPSYSSSPKELSAKYSLHMLGANIGEFLISQTQVNGNISITGVTDVKMNFLLSYHVKYVQNTVYEQGILKSSQVKTYKNGKLNSDMVLNKEKDVYLLVANGDTTVINESITYSGSLLYFIESLGVERMYKERTAEMQQIMPLSEHTYIVKDKKERELNRYIYKNGVLEYAKMQHTLGALVLKRVREE